MSNTWERKVTSNKGLQFRGRGLWEGGRSYDKNKTHTKKNGCHNLDISALKSRFSPHTWTVIESRTLLQIILKDSKSLRIRVWVNEVTLNIDILKTEKQKQNSQQGTAYSEKSLISFLFLREACRVWVKCSGIPADGLIVVLGNCRTITAEQNH